MSDLLGFLLALVALLVISQKNLGLAMFTGAIILGVFTVPSQLPTTFWLTFTDPSTILLAVIVGLIPIIGGVLKASGQMDSLVGNLRIGKRPFLMLSPALVGLLPMPGGALLSAPLIEKGGRDLSNEKKAGINVWFRHVLYLIYPISPDLMVSAQAAQLGVYQTIPYLTPILLLSLLLGYFFFLRDITGKIEYSGEFSIRGLVLPLSALLAAPIIDVLVKTFMQPTIEEAATLIGVSASLLITLAIWGARPRKLGMVVLEAEPWSFASMVIGIMFFLNVFKRSGIPQLVETTNITPETLFIVGFLLGFGTGRIVTPAGIVFPIFLTKFGAISLPTFAFTYFSIFLGYVVTPVHPCVSLSVESFKTKIKEYLRTVMPPTIIALVLSFLFLCSANLP